MRSLTVILGCLTVATTSPAQTPNWTEIKPSTSPSARAGHEIVYDSARQRTVLFGGLRTGASVFLSDTWEWDGVNWVQITPTNSPSARHSFAMAYDSVRQRTVLFGGRSRSGTIGDTWEWDGSNWTRIVPKNSPSARSHLMMAYDSVRQRTVLFGGIGSPRAETWEWDGQNWTQAFPNTAPSNRPEYGIAYDSARQRTVLFGGTLGGLGDTWEWNGTNWTQIMPRTSPSPRVKPAMAYDSARQRTVLFGGTTGSGRFGDTWEWNGTNWTRIAPLKSPSARAHAGYAYDSVRQRTVLFGGQVGNSALYNAETWEYGVANLTLTANPPTISIANGGTQNLTLNAGTGLGNKSYWIFGSMTGTMPGTNLLGIHIPLNQDLYMAIALVVPNSKEFTNFKGTLNAKGLATASLNVPANIPFQPGLKLYHSYVVYDGTTGQIFTSSNPVSVEFK